MQPLIHKASVNLTANKLPLGVSLNDAVILCLNDDGKITAILTLPSRLPFGIGKPRKIALGTLGQHATNLIKPALEKSAYWNAPSEVVHQLGYDYPVLGGLNDCWKTRKAGRYRAEASAG